MTQPLKYRTMRLSEVKEAMDLVWQVFEEFEAPEYTPEGIQEFREFIEVARFKAYLTAGDMKAWICLNQNEEICGLIALRPPNHISLLFVHKQYHRQGIAKKLFQIMTAHMREQYESASAVTVNSSPYAVHIYKKLGFTPLEPEKTINGIRFTPMSASLSNPWQDEKGS